MNAPPPGCKPGALPDELKAVGASGRARTVSSRLRGECPTCRAALALSRGATPLDGEQPPVYTIAGDINGITVALQIGDRTTVGLTFTGAGLTDATKLALLGKAAELAAA